MNELGPAEFSAATGLSVKALRLYDERGLLVPARVDRATGYRRYVEDQIATAGRIALLRRAGVGLADIKRFLAAPPTSGVSPTSKPPIRVGANCCWLPRKTVRSQAPPWASCPPGQR